MASVTLESAILTVVTLASVILDVITELEASSPEPTELLASSPCVIVSVAILAAVTASLAIFAVVTESFANLAVLTAESVISLVAIAPLDAAVTLPCASTVMSAAEYEPAVTEVLAILSAVTASLAIFAVVI